MKGPGFDSQRVHATFLIASVKSRGLDSGKSTLFLAVSVQCILCRCYRARGVEAIVTGFGCLAVQHLTAGDPRGQAFKRLTIEILGTTPSVSTASIWLPLAV